MDDTKIKSFVDLRVWQEAHVLVINIYNSTKQFPEEERFGLTNQLRRAAVSITSNISEGFNRYSQKEKLQFYYISLGSIAEVQNQILIAKDVGFLKSEEFDKINLQLTVVQKLLNALISTIRSSLK